MKKILQIPNYMYPHIGGIEQVARDIADSLIGDEGIEQKIICFNGDATDGDYICHQKKTVIDKVDGIDVTRCGCFTKIASQSLSVTYPRELKKNINEFEPDIVIFHYPNPFVGEFLQHYFKNDFKLVVYWHLDITKQRILGKLFHGQTIRLLNRADKIVATSPNYIEGSQYLRKYKEKCIVIPNCIRTERLQPNAEVMKKVEEIKKKYNGKVLCFGMGRHVPYKGYTYLIKASKHLDDEFAICIAGKGPLTESLKEEAKEDKKVEFLGRVSDEDMIAYYMACDIFCFPSITKNEAFGIALAEGMYFEKPTVTFTIPGSGVNYVSIANKTGIECPNGDVEAYAEAMKKLAADADLRKKYGVNAKERVVDNFMFEKFLEKIRDLIAEL